MWRAPAVLSLAISLFAFLPASALGLVGDSGQSQDQQTAQSPIRIEVEIVVNAPRPKPLPMLYAGYVALQVGDVITTNASLRSGVREWNPLLRGIASSPIKLGLVKAGGTVATIYAVERLWRKGHRKTAVVTMVATSSLMAVVIANNIRTASRAR